MKFKAMIAMLAAACIVILGAWLPRLVGQRLDQRNEKQVFFAQVEAVELEFAQSDMTRSQILSILRNTREAVQIPEELASLKREKIEKIVLSTVEKYAQAGVLPDNFQDAGILSCQTLLYYGAGNQNNVYWQIHYGSEQSGALFIFTIDDRTGMVCSTEYSCPQTQFPPEQMDAVLSSFVTVHLTGLGDEFYDYPINDLLAQAKSGQDQSYLATEFLWEDPGYGQGSITFFVNQSGFYTYFS